MKQSKLLAVVLCLVLPAILSTGALQAQHDLGPRGGLPGAGGAFPTLNANEQAFFNQAFLRFQEVQSVSGDISGEDSEGLGPTFNGNSCTMCHAQPPEDDALNSAASAFARPMPNTSQDEDGYQLKDADKPESAGALPPALEREENFVDAASRL